LNDNEVDEHVDTGRNEQHEASEISLLIMVGGAAILYDIIAWLWPYFNIYVTPVFCHNRSLRQVLIIDFFLTLVSIRTPAYEFAYNRFSL
jgi:hypothetical protein